MQRVANMGLTDNVLVTAISIIILFFPPHLYSLSTFFLKSKKIVLKKFIRAPNNLRLETFSDIVCNFGPLGGNIGLSRRCSIEDSERRASKKTWNFLWRGGGFDPISPILFHKRVKNNGKSGTCFTDLYNKKNASFFSYWGGQKMESFNSYIFWHER